MFQIGTQAQGKYIAHVLYIKKERREYITCVCRLEAEKMAIMKEIMQK